VIDAKGRRVQLPVMRPAQEEDAEKRQQNDTDADRKLLKAVIDNPSATIRDYATATGLSRSAIDRRLKRLEKERLVEHVLDQWMITPKGQKAA
jgi:DNA-binding MarR family transcriptional regulator